MHLSKSQDVALNAFLFVLYGDTSIEDILIDGDDLLKRLITVALLLTSIINDHSLLIR